MTTIPYGLLPTPSMLHPRAVAAGVGTSSLLAVMRESLKRHGPNDGLHAVLRAVGFTWAAPSVSDLEVDVAAVADALNSPAAPPPDSRHGAAEPGPGPTLRRGRQTVPGTTGGDAGDLVEGMKALTAALTGGGR